MNQMFCVGTKGSLAELEIDYLKKKSFTYFLDFMKLMNLSKKEKIRFHMIKSDFYFLLGKMYHNTIFGHSVETRT